MATTRPARRATTTKKAPAKKAAPKKAPKSTDPQAGQTNEGPSLSHDTRQVNRRKLARQERDATTEIQPVHTAGHAGGRTEAEKIANGEDVGTIKGLKPSASVSEPLAEGTQLFITGKHFPSRVPARIEIKGPFRDELRSSRTDPFGNVQIGLHNPDAGKHSVTIKAGGKTAKVAFETAGRNA